MPLRSAPPNPFTNPEPELDEFLRSPARRDGAERFMGHTRRRMRATAKVLVGLFGSVGLLVVGIALFSLSGAADAGSTLGLALGCFAGIVLMIGVPTWLYLRQDVSVGLRLLEHGSLVHGEVARVGTTPHGVAVVTVAWSRGGRAVESTFRLPSAPPELASLVGATMPLLHLEGSLGLWQPGEGLVTTR